MNISGIRKLFTIVQEHGLKYLLTTKSNQDALENLFGELRSRGGLNYHPSPLNVLYRLRMIILDKNSGVVSTSSNTNDMNQEEFMVANTFKQINFNITDNEKNEDTNTDTDTINDNQSKNVNEMTQDATEYLAGWIAKKFRIKFPEFGCTTTQFNTSRVNDHNYQLHTWIEHLSYGGLIVRSNDFEIKIFRIEKLFKKITKCQIPRIPSVVKQLTHKMFDRMDIDKKYYPVIQAYVKQRIFI
ncbi:THAP-type domain-containing protein [Aphis craccivora]|uniref:THAP-type domain-containing protein n=1 Tax=Aphis craccivora TaxID=307492 RepID=A0A6G0WDC2_APHCR|nr:THAP-type domain-containing protein [Aphis craccivora]